MATLHAHPALQPMSVGRGREDPSSPAPSDADMLPPNRDISSSRHRAIEPSVQRAYAQPSPSSSSGGASPSSRDVPELGPVRAFLMPMRHKPVPALSNLLLHSSYELGAPLSDIGEEETSPRLRRARSRSPSPPTTGSSTTGHQSPASWSRKSEKRLSEMSSSSSISLGSDLQWDGFDTRYGMSDRLRADLAAAGDDNSSVDGLASKRDSAIMYGDEETTTQALSSRAEQILANAKKRLTNMEGNLSRARTSLLVTQGESPSSGENKQSGGLYRSVSQGGGGRPMLGSSLRKSRPSYPITNGAHTSHMRNFSETSVPSGSARHTKPSEVRSASAMEYGYGDKSIDSVLYGRADALSHGRSLASSRLQKSPLTALREEGACPLTIPPSVNAFQYNEALGGRNHRYHRGGTSNDSGPGLRRSQSQISTRELQDQMNGLRNKISGLRTGQQADQARRSSIQNLRTASSIAQAEEWYTGAAEYKGGESPLSTNAGMGWRSREDLEAISARPTASPQCQTLQSSRGPGSPKFPQSASLAKEPSLDFHRSGLTPVAHSVQDVDSYSSSANAPTAPRDDEGDRDDRDSHIQESHYDDGPGGEFDEADDPVVSSEEEQIYLNGVLEESLQDADPEVPPIPDVIQMVEPERHEDRADAFDYEHFFLHSALGNYSPDGFHRRNLSQATAESHSSRESSDSIVTTRAPPIGEDGRLFEEDAEGPRRGGRERTGDGGPVEGQPPGASAPEASVAQHFRSNSIDSVSTVATFATATQGDHDSGTESDSVPSEILRWGEGVVPSMVGAWPGPAANPARSQGSPTTGRAFPPGKKVIEAEQVTADSVAVPTLRASSPLQPAEVAGDDSDDGSHHQPANTEILISALITLANPNFQSAGYFTEMDKDLVVNVLRSVGAVCEGITASDSKGDVDESHVWRRKLETARRILDGEIEIEED